MALITHTRAQDLFERLCGGGREAVEELIRARESEELFLDFKRATKDGAGARLEDEDRNNLGKAISGFANSEGGVIVWGVDCREAKRTGDVAQAIVAIQDAKRFVSWLEGAVSGCTLPPHQGVRSVAVGVDEIGNGLAVTFVPKGEIAPFRSVGLKQYYIRSGSSFAPTPHDVLAGMFGRRPQPHIFESWTIGLTIVEEDQDKELKQWPLSKEDERVETSVQLLLTNAGPGIARDLFMTIDVSQRGGPNNALLLRPKWRRGGLFQAKRMPSRMSLICPPGVRVPPGAEVCPVEIIVLLKPPFTGELSVRGSVGAAETPPRALLLRASKAHQKKVYRLFDTARREGISAESVGDLWCELFPELGAGIKRQ